METAKFFLLYILLPLVGIFNLLAGKRMMTHIHIKGLPKKKSTQLILWYFVYQQFYLFIIPGIYLTKQLFSNRFKHDKVFVKLILGLRISYILFFWVLYLMFFY